MERRRSCTLLSRPVPDPATAVRQSTSLTCLDVSRNDLAAFPPTIDQLVQLKTLELDGNRLSGSLPAAVFSRLHRLSTLYLSGNDFSGAVPDGLPTCAAPSCGSME